MTAPQRVKASAYRFASPLRIIASMLGAVALASLVFVLVALMVLRAQILGAAERDAASRAVLVEEKVARTLQVVDLTLVDVSGDIQRNRPRPYFDEDWMHQLLRTRLVRLPYVRAIWVLDPQGRIVYDSDTGNIGHDLSDRDYFVAHRQDPKLDIFIGDPVVSRSVGEWFVSVSRAVRRADGTLENVVVAALQNRYFAELWRGVDVGEQGWIALLSRAGKVMLRSPQAEGTIGQSFAGTTAFRELLPKSEAFTYRNTSSDDGVDRIVSVRAVHDYPNIVALVGRSVPDVLAQWQQFLILGVGLWLAAMGVMSVLAHFLLRELRGRALAEKRVESLARFPLENPSPIVRIGADGAIQYANPPAIDLQTAISAETAGSSQQRWQSVIDAAKVADATAMFEADLVGKSYAFTAAPVTQARYVNLYGTDITRLKRTQRALEQSEDLFRQLAGTIPEAFWVSDIGSNRILYASPGCETISGRPRPTTVQALFDCLHPDDAERVAERTLHARPGTIDLEFRIVRPDGLTRWVHVQTFAIHNESGEIYRVAGMGTDITDQKAAEERLLRMAHSDALTDLPNRKLFHDSLKRTLEHARDHQWTVGVLFIDLDRFKIINDTLGHAVGDKLVLKVAERLVECVRVRDVVGRLGGDEFGILLRLASADEAGAVANNILHSLAEPFDLEGRETFVTASIGIAIYPTDADDPDTLLRYADTAMYRAKDDGRNTYRYYTAEMNVRAAERLELETALRRALVQEEFRIHYQPKLDLKSGAISGAEALLRWQRPGVGIVLPADFMPLLEETGLIVAVGEWVIGEACRQVGAWNAAGIRPVPVAINLSARQFRHEMLARRITQALEKHCVHMNMLEIEITESLLMSTGEPTAKLLEVLREAGARVSIDDFGTGYSSLSYLKRFPIDAIKIDKSFVRDITTDSSDAAIVLAVISMARQLGLKVVAEGVETNEQMEFLRGNGCDEIQGYVFSRPIRVEDFTEMLRRRQQQAG